MNFHIVTFGCKVNQCESEYIRRAMINKGFKLCDHASNADVVIINSCTVTGESDRKLRQMIRKIKKANESCVLVLAGCMPQAAPEAAKELENVDVVIGNSDKTSIPEVVRVYVQNKIKVFNVTPIKNIKEFEKTEVDRTSYKSRAFLKIEDGCNRFCSYCIIPYARGEIRSKPIDDIKKDAQKLAENGYKEIVLVGINLSSYGKDLNLNLYDAVHSVCSVCGIERVRLGSLEPDLMTDDLINKLSLESKLCPQFHLSLQSGCDKILKKMRRRYNREEYMNLIQKLRFKFKDAAFTTDIMVGFPGETEEDFMDSLDIIEKAKFLKVHVFPYSPRPGTPAANMPDQIDNQTKAERVKKMIEISNKSSRIVLNNFINEKMDVLYETLNKDSFYEGYTANYIPVKSKSNEDLRGKIINTKLIKVRENFFEGSFTQTAEE